MTVQQQAQGRSAPVFVRHTGIAAPFLQHNVNTDVISPLNPNPILPGAARQLTPQPMKPDGLP